MMTLLLDHRRGVERDVEAPRNVTNSNISALHHGFSGDYNR